MEFKIRYIVYALVALIFVLWMTDRLPKISRTVFTELAFLGIMGILIFGFVVLIRKLKEEHRWNR